MKKLLVLSLTVVMVLAFAAVSMAAPVTVGGELDFGKQWVDTQGQSMSQDFGKADACVNVNFTAQIADDVTAKAVLKGKDADMFVDEAWVQFTEDYGTIKVGYFGYNQNQKDIIDAIINDIKSDLTVSYSAKIADAFTLNLAAANQTQAVASAGPPVVLADKGGLDYSIGLAFDADVFGANINYFKYESNVDAYYSAMGYYKLDALKFYAQYEAQANQNNQQNFIVGGVYDSADVPLFVRAEYDLNNQGKTTNDWAVRLAYKVTANYKFQYTMFHQNSTDYIKNELLLITTF